MIRILALILTIAGMIGLIMGVLGIFGSTETGVNPWPVAILGGVFFLSGVSMLKYRKDSTDVKE
ncbi:hypothetical protein [Abyssalbus ytuae]|uniref:Uncharacterized protein n=1 Tax=Abyssalbus ytuae TaxID=2926907 RepID=A0A9E6ZPL3_9FLAO|nr:hypothetical protein [Abyssalbus ytuae]UOB16428.1 hypothetical protein MQE35_11845 [Abyssalbus ytuae]